jgi:hypothetical protein
MKIAAVVRLLSHLKSSGTSEGAVKGWDTRGRVHHDDYVHGIHIGIFNRPERANQYAPSATKFFARPVPDMAEREHVNRMFKQAEQVGTRLLSLKDLTPMQKTIVQSRVDRMEQKRNEPEWMAAHLPSVFNYNGKQYVMDGHHRVAYDADTGKDTTLAKVYAIRQCGNA